MRFGVRLPNSGPLAYPEAITIMATAAEQLGYYAVSVHDHVHWGHENDRYHFYAGSRELADAQGWPSDFYEAFSTMSYLAGITRRVKLLPAALCLGWRPIALVIREALTLDRLSGGRFILCVCIGDSQRDYDAINMPWEKRGRTMDEHLRVLRAALDNPGRFSFEWSHGRFEDTEWKPRPVHLPLWYGSRTDIGVKRVARYCDGWMGGTPETFRAKLPLLHQEAERVGRGDVDFDLATQATICIAQTDKEAQNISRAMLEVRSKGPWLQFTYPSTMDAKDRQPPHIPLVGAPETVAATVREYADVGVGLINLHFIGHSLGSILEQMEFFAREVMPQAM